jgi:hypothetical protein
MVKQEICYVICKHTLLFLEILQTAPNYLAYRRLHLHTVLQTKLFAGVYSKNHEKRVFLQTVLFYGFGSYECMPMGAVALGGEEIG